MQARLKHPACSTQHLFNAFVIAHMRAGLEQYAIGKFAEAFEVVPRMLAENSGLNATDVVSSLYAAHAQGQTSAGGWLGAGVLWGRGWFAVSRRFLLACLSRSCPQAASG